MRFVSGGIGMQDVHEILAVGGGGSGGRIFGDRRLRAAAQGHHHHQALKCPRCDSLNTKFCYYNNYNLSQPRHFCKNCRRYWTKGGVLRNVPVGGGCRKSKRSSKRKTSASPPPRTSAEKERHKSSSGSSSESTSANAASTGTKAQSTGYYAGAVSSGKAIGVVKTVSEAGSDYSSSPLFKFSELPPATFNFTSTARQPSFSGMNADLEALNNLQASAGTDPGAGGMFTEMGGFVSIMDGDQHRNLLGFGDVGHIESTPFGIHQQNQVNNQLLLQNLSARDWQKEKINGVEDDWGAGIFDQTVYFDLLSNNKTGDVDGALAGQGWQGVPGGSVGGGGGHLGMFDLTPGSDWSQSSQWNESDHHLYLPP